MNTFHQILDFLDGKKSTILAITAAILSYAVAGNIIDADLGALLQTILSILGGGAVYATNKLGQARRMGIVENKKD